MLDGKVVLVSGGAGLLGRSFARRIADCGGTVVVADRDAVAAERVAEDVARSCPGRAVAVDMDITDKESVCATIATVAKRYGRIDAVVNSAYPRNRNYGRKLEDVTYADFCENVDLHLGGYFLVAQQFGQFFRTQGAGNIINMSSIYGIVAPRFEIYGSTHMTMPVEYAAIKSGVIQLTRYFAQYYKGAGIRVNCLSPGGILDNQPAEFLGKYNAYCNEKGMLDPGNIAGVLTFLLSEDSRFITGQNFIVDDGFSL